MRPLTAATLLSVASTLALMPASSDTTFTIRRGFDGEDTDIEVSVDYDYQPADPIMDVPARVLGYEVSLHGEPVELTPREAADLVEYIHAIEAPNVR